MRTRFSLDTNALLRFMLNDIPQQAHATKKLFIEAKREKCIVYVSLLVFVEAVFVLSRLYKLDKKVICEKLAGIITLPFLEITERSLLLAGIKMYKDNTISFIDSLLLYDAKTHQTSLFSFDKALLKLERSL